MVWLNNLGFTDPYGTTSRAVDALFTGGARDLGNGLVVVRIGDAHPLLSATIECLATGECGTTSTPPDPLLDWVYAPRDPSEVCKPLAAEPSAFRLQWFRWLASYSAYFALARNGLYALVHAAAPGRVIAAAVTGPPGAIPFGRMSGGEMGDWCQKAGMEMAIEVLANNMRNRVLGTWMGRAHGDAGGRHLDIVIFATAPECQGRGIGTALLRFLGEVADADGVPTHLETAGTRNTGFYAKKGGFAVVHRSPVASFDHEGGGVAMQRPPMAVAGGVAPPGKSVRDERRGAGSPQASAPELAPAMPDVASDRSLPSQFGTARCPGFLPKRPWGPLESYCASCGAHRTKCTST